MYFEGAFARQPNHIGAAIFIKQFQKHYLNQLTGAEYFNPNQGYSDSERLFFLNNYFFTNNNYLNQLLTTKNHNQQSPPKGDQTAAIDSNSNSQSKIKTGKSENANDIEIVKNTQENQIGSLVEQIKLRKLNSSTDEVNKLNLFTTTTSIKQQDLKDKDCNNISNTTENQAQIVNNVIEKLRSLASKSQLSSNLMSTKKDGK